ncbi:MAG: DUF2059 domain-containing protein [Ferruginibacter sp.]|nr:DUF2059 domain-containing protein [Cytophagales bacterium]
MKAFVIAAWLLLVTFQLGFGQVRDSHRAAAEAMLVATQAENNFDASIDQLLAQQVGQNPGMKDYEGVMKTFFAKYMSWNALKEEMTKLYTDEFSEEELKKLTVFYQTDVGKKMVAKQTVILQKSMALGQQLVRSHMPELQEAIQKRREELEKK